MNLAEMDAWLAIFLSFLIFFLIFCNQINHLIWNSMLNYFFGVSKPFLFFSVQPFLFFFFFIQMAYFSFYKFHIEFREMMLRERARDREIESFLSLFLIQEMMIFFFFFCNAHCWNRILSSSVELESIQLVIGHGYFCHFIIFGQMYPCPITNWILSSSTELERIQIPHCLHS
jgi:hypothetical protein